MKKLPRLSSEGSVKGAKSPLRVQSTGFSNFFKVRKTARSVSKRLFRHAADVPKGILSDDKIVPMSGFVACAGYSRTSEG